MVSTTPSDAAVGASVPTTVVHVDIPPVPGLEPAEVEALQRAVVALGVHVGGGQPDVDAVLTAFRSDGLVDAFATEIVANALVEPVDLGRFVGLLNEAAGERRAGLQLLAARFAEWLGQAVIAERHVRAGLALDPGSQHLLLDAAWYASDAGDAGEAARLLRAAGAPEDDPELALLARYEPAAVATANRNSECPCGSGRRAKRCCRSNGGHDLARRLPWLHAKAVAFARRPPQQSSLLAVAADLAGTAQASEHLDRIAGAASETVAANLVLFEGEAMAAFVAARGALLPPDERRLAARWVRCRHAVLEPMPDGRLVDRRTGRTTTDPVAGVAGDEVVVGVLVPTPTGGCHLLDGAHRALRPVATGPNGELDGRRIGDAIRPDRLDQEA